MRVLIFGASGLLGKALLQEWTGDEVIPLSTKDADIRDANAVRAAIDRAHPDWVVLSAAYTDVDGCETNSDLAFDVNFRGAVNVAHACVETQLGCSSGGRKAPRLLFLSSDYVFDGKK